MLLTRFGVVSGSSEIGLELLAPVLDAREVHVVPESGEAVGGVKHLHPATHGAHPREGDGPFAVHAHCYALNGQDDGVHADTDHDFFILGERPRVAQGAAHLTHLGGYRVVAEGSERGL